MLVVDQRDDIRPAPLESYKLPSERSRLLLRISAPLLRQATKASEANANIHPLKLSGDKEALQRCILQVLYRWANDCTDAVDAHQFGARVFSEIKHFFRQYGSKKETTSWLMTWVIYSSRYFLKRPTTQIPQLWKMLHIAALITLKFWNDFEIIHSDVADLFRMPIRTLAISERRFLETLDYQLYISAKSMARFEALLSVKPA
jgi:hypothetical protein